MADVQHVHGLLSPAATPVAYEPNDILPTPRSHSLPANSTKRTALINYLDERMLHLSRRYNKSFAANPTDRGDDSGFTHFSQVIAEIDGLLNVVWISATIEIQIPYLLALAGNFRGFMHSFDFDTDSFFLARKFDQAFSQLLTTVHTIDETEKVRIRSLAEETRFEMVDVASKNGHETSRTAEDADEDDDYDLETDAGQPDDTQSRSQSIALNLGKVYEKTLEILGGDVSSLPPLTSKRDPSPPQITDDVEIIDL